MSDIFEIKSLSTQLKIGEAYYSFVDPKIVTKVQITKEWDELEKSKDSLDKIDYFLKVMDLNKRMIRMHIPSLPDEALEDMGENGISALMTLIKDLSEKKFGVSAQQVEKK